MLTHHGACRWVGDSSFVRFVVHVVSSFMVNIVFHVKREGFILPVYSKSRHTNKFLKAESPFITKTRYWFTHSGIEICLPTYYSTFSIMYQSISTDACGRKYLCVICLNESGAIEENFMRFNRDLSKLKVP